MGEAGVNPDLAHRYAALTRHIIMLGGKNCIRRIADDIHDDLIEQRRLAVQPVRGIILPFDRNAAAQLLGQQRHDRFQRLGHVDDLEQPFIKPREFAQVQHKVLDAPQPHVHRPHPVAALGQDRAPLVVIGVGGRVLHRREPVKPACHRVLMRQDEGQRVVDLVRDARHQFTQRGHLGGLHQLALGFDQLAVGIGQFTVGLLQRLGQRGFRCNGRRLRARS
ncbi:hypothetical protein KOXY103107_06975 [Komagataeibacter xylinus]